VDLEIVHTQSQEMETTSSYVNVYFLNRDKPNTAGTDYDLSGKVRTRNLTAIWRWKMRICAMYRR